MYKYNLKMNKIICEICKCNVINLKRHQESEKCRKKQKEITTKKENKKSICEYCKKENINNMKSHQKSKKCIQSRTNLENQIIDENNKLIEVKIDIIKKEREKLEQKLQNTLNINNNTLNIQQNIQNNNINIRNEYITHDKLMIYLKNTLYHFSDSKEYLIKDILDMDEKNFLEGPSKWGPYIINKMNEDLKYYISYNETPYYMDDKGEIMIDDRLKNLIDVCKPQLKKLCNLLKKKAQGKIIELKHEKYEQNNKEESDNDFEREENIIERNDQDNKISEYIKELETKIEKLITINNKNINGLTNEKKFFKNSISELNVSKDIISFYFYKNKQELIKL